MIERSSNNQRCVIIFRKYREKRFKNLSSELSMECSIFVLAKQWSIFSPNASHTSIFKLYSTLFTCQFFSSDESFHFTHLNIDFFFSSVNYSISVNLSIKYYLIERRFILFSSKYPVDLLLFGTIQATPMETGLSSVCLSNTSTANIPDNNNNSTLVTDRCKLTGNFQFY